MTENQIVWSQARDRLASAVVSLGYPDEFADLLAKQLKSPKAIQRLAAYVKLAHPAKMEMIVDEMLAIRAEIETWQKKKESETAQAKYNAWLDSDIRWKNESES